MDPLNAAMRPLLSSSDGVSTITASSDRTIPVIDDPSGLTAVGTFIVGLEPGEECEANACFILDTKKIILHSFTHLGEEKAEPEMTRALPERARRRMEGAGYDVAETPFGYFLDLVIKAPGKPLARISKEF